MTNILKCLKIFDFNTLYIKSKLSFLESIKKNEICSQIFNYLCSDLNNTKKDSKSFQKDVLLLQSHFDIDIELIFAGPSRLRDLLIKDLHTENGLCDSIMLCLNNINKKYYKNLLDVLIRENDFGTPKSVLHDAKKCLNSAKNKSLISDQDLFF
jgi:hypothetical protein